MILLIFIIISCIIAIPFSIGRTRKKSMITSNEKFNKYIEENNITVTKYVDIPTAIGSSKFIVDENNNSVYFLVTNNNTNDIKAKKISFKDVIKVELIKDSKTKLIEDKFSFFDNYNKKEYVKKLGLRITFNDLSFPHLDILFLNSMTGQTLFGLGNIVNSVQEWISVMNIVIERGKEFKAQ